MGDAGELGVGPELRLPYGTGCFGAEQPAVFVGAVGGQRFKQAPHIRRRRVDRRGRGGQIDLVVLRGELAVVEAVSQRQVGLQLGSDLDGAAAHARRIEDQFFHRLVVGLAGDLLQQQAGEHDAVGVVTHEASGLVGAPQVAAQELGEWRPRRLPGGQGILETAELSADSDLVEGRGVGHQVPHAHRFVEGALEFQVVDQRRHVVIEAQAALVDQPGHRKRRQRLGDRADAEQGAIGFDRTPGLDVGHPIAAAEDRAATLDHDHGGAGQVAFAHHPLDGLVDPPGQPFGVDGSGGGFGLLRGRAARRRRRPMTGNPGR